MMFGDFKIWKNVLVEDFYKTLFKFYSFSVGFVMSLKQIKNEIISIYTFKLIVVISNTNIWFLIKPYNLSCK